MKYQAVVVAGTGMRAEVFDSFRREFAEKSEVAANKRSSYTDERRAEQRHTCRPLWCG